MAWPPSDVCGFLPDIWLFFAGSAFAEVEMPGRSQQSYLRQPSLWGSRPRLILYAVSAFILASCATSRVWEQL